MSENKSLGPVLQFIDAGKHSDPYLTVDKIQERARIIDDANYPESIVFELKRHSGILGTVYQSGQPMEAFITFWPVYVFDQETETLKELESRREPEVTIKDWLFVDREIDNLSFQFHEHEEEGYICEEVTLNETCHVKNHEDIRQFATGIVDEMNYSFYLEELQMYMEEDRARDKIEGLMEDLKEALVKKAVDSWKYFQENRKEGK